MSRFADDKTLEYIAKLERELAAERESIGLAKVVIEQKKKLLLSCESELAAARQREGEMRASVIEECATVCDKVGARLSAGAGYACKIASEEIRNSA